MWNVLILSVIGIMRVACILRIVSISPNNPTLQNSPDITVIRIRNEMASAASNVAAKSSA